MTEREQRPPLHRSVFARLIVIMLAMAAALLALVAGFYFMIVIPNIHASIDEVLSSHARALANTEPDLETARRFGEKINVEVRYENNQGGGWSTDDSVPRRAEIERLSQGGHWQHLLRFGHFLFAPQYIYYVANTSTGSYIFARRSDERYAKAHTRLLLLLMLVMAGVFLTAYLVLKRALRPLRLLDEGVTRISAGQLDVVVPKHTQDEFGVLTDAFNRMARRVRDMVQARDQLLLDVSHELRSPLTRLKVALEMVPDGKRKQSMSADLDEMEALVAELLELHRMQDVATIRRERCDLVALVRETTARLHGQGPGITLSSALDTLALDVDVERVRMVLRNVIENALKFSLPDSRTVEIHVSQDDSHAVVRVIDDGSGVPAGDVERLFEPFFRLDPSRSRTTGGYGLGLSICKRVMDAHAGTISIEPRDGRGVTVVLRFPLP